MLKLLNASILAGVLLLVGCNQKTVRTDRLNVPITISKEEWRKASFSIKKDQPLSTPGKIYRKGDFLFINEINKGVHVYNNSNPSSPMKVSFLEIFKNTEMAIYDDVLYVNSYTDLLMLNISNPNSIVEAGRLKDVFTIDLLDVQDGFNMDYLFENFNPNEEVVLGWNVEEVETEVEDTEMNLSSFYGDFFEGSNVLETGDNAVFFNTTTASSGPITGSGSGIGGSMAKFTISGNILFLLEDRTILSYDISQATTPKYIGEVNTNREAQTLFPRGNQLFVGTTSGMIIYDGAKSGNLNFLSVMDHFTSCDPVVVHGNRAYVTLSSGCWNQMNQLDVVDISDLTDPVLLKSYDFTHPLGLGVDENILFLCDDRDGLKVFDVTDPLQVDQNQLSHFSSINAFDVIPYNDLLILVGTQGVVQYDYSDVQQIVELSTISIQ